MGGVGVHDLVNCNNSFGGKLVWHMYYKPHTKWCHIMQQIYLDNNCPSRVLSVLDRVKGSNIWDFMMSPRDVFIKYITWEVNNGVKAKF